MKKLLLLLLIFCGTNCVAQLYFASGSYMYVADRFVYVKQDVNLQNNAAMLLRNGGQLLQGTIGASANSGGGKLSVFQEGNVDNFEYNYWCSPVGNASAASGNEAFGISMLNRPTLVNTSVPATILPMASLDGATTNSSLAIAPFWVFRFLSSVNYSDWIATGAATSIAPGEGFTMKGTSGTDNIFAENGVVNNPGGAQRYDFQGKPNDGNIIINVATAKMTLTGNPYPSAIDLRSFLLAQTNCTGVAYFWEQDKTVNSHVLANYQGGYGVYAAGSNLYTAPIFYGYNSAGSELAAVGSGTFYAREFSPIGQGFMIEGAANGTVTMSNTYRVFKKEGVDTSFSRRSGGENTILSANSDAITPHITFNVWLNDVAVRQLILSFSPLATDGVDRAWDAKSAGSEVSDSYFPIAGDEYSIAAVNFDINKRIPIAFKNSVAQTFKITVSDMVNFSDADHVYLHDKLNGTYFEILNNVEQFSAPAGNDLTRYEITFVNDQLNVPDLSDSSFAVLQNNALEQLEIANPEQLDIKSCSIYDMTGKLVILKTKLGAESRYVFSTAGLSDGVYIVRILTAKGQAFGRKISVFKKNN